MKILRNDAPKIGSKVILRSDLHMHDCIYTAGHMFRITEFNERGFNMIDEEGNEVHEFGRIGDIKYEIID